MTCFRDYSRGVYATRRPFRDSQVRTYSGIDGRVVVRGTRPGESRAERREALRRAFHGRPVPPEGPGAPGHLRQGGKAPTLGFCRDCRKGRHFRPFAKVRWRRFSAPFGPEVSENTHSATGAQIRSTMDRSRRTIVRIPLSLPHQGLTAKIRGPRR